MPQAVTFRDRAAVARPRLVRDAIVLGNSTVLARRAVAHGCYCIVKPDDGALIALLSQAYEKRINGNDPILLSVLRAADVLLKSPERVDCLLAHLPEPSAAGLVRLPQAERLLKAGTSSADLEGALRRDQLGLLPTPAYAAHQTLCKKGVALGNGIVIAAIEDSSDGSAGLAVKGREERILTLLSVASGRAVDAGVLTKFEAASRALAGGNVTLAAIHLAHVGLLPLAHTGMAKALGLAATELDRGVGPFDLLKGLDLLPAGMGYADWSPTLRKFNHNHVPAGCPEGGQFCSADLAGSGNTVTDASDVVIDPSGGNASTGATQIDDTGQTQIAQNDAIDFTDHAWQRMKERGISPSDVTDTVKNGVRVIQINSNIKCTGNTCVVVINKLGGVVTVYKR